MSIHLPLVVDGPMLAVSDDDRRYIPIRSLHFDPSWWPFFLLTAKMNLHLAASR